MIRKWTYPTKDWHKTDIETAKFIFNQAESMLSHLTSSRRHIDTKATILIAVIVPLLTIMIGVVTGIGFGSDIPKAMIAFTLISSIFLLGAMILCLFVLLPREVVSEGSEPERLISIDLIESESEHQELEAYVNEIENYQNRIDYNRHANDKKAKLLRYAIILTSISPLPIVAMFIFRAITS